MQDANRAWAHLPEVDRTDLDAHKGLDRMPRLIEHATHDVLAPFVQGDLDHRVTAGEGDHLEVVHSREAVLEFDTGLQPTPEVSRNGSVDRRDVGLGHTV